MPDGDTPVRARPRVLVVDDEAPVTELVVELLQQEGFDATALTDPEEALRQAGAYDVILLDLNMPRLGGLEVAERIRERWPEIQVIILTGRDDSASVVSGLQVGAFDYIFKADLAGPALAAAVRRAGERTRLLQERTRLSRDLGEANRLLEALQGLGQSVGDELNVSEVLSRLVATAKDLTNAESGRALLFAPTHSEEGLLIEAAAGDQASGLQGVRLGPEEGIGTFVAMIGQSVRVERAADHPRYSHKCDELPSALPGFLCVALRQGAVLGALSLSGRKDGPFDDDASVTATMLATQATIILDGLFSHERAGNFFTHMMELLVSILDSLDVQNPGHSRAVATVVDRVTRHLGLPDAERRNVHYAALLHDIGKLRLPPELLQGNEPFPAHARREMERHPTLAVEMLKHISVLSDILPIIHAHHERWDGKGYPSGLAGEDIPVGARVVAVADAFDAMTHEQSWAPAKDPEVALAELLAGAGTQFDPRMVELFIKAYRQQQDETRGD